MNVLTTASRTSLVLALAAALVAGGAQAASVDYVGFGWSSGGVPADQAGQELAVATVVTQMDPLFEVDLAQNEATLFITGLVSQGPVVDPVSGATVTNYSGGTIAVYASPVRNHDWGVNPANGTVPSTFTDGDLVFSGDFTGFAVTMLPSGMGVYEGFIDATGGSAVAGPCSNCAYTFSGVFDATTGAQIPEGYDLQVDGALEIESAIDAQDTSWGSLKQLYNPNR